MTLRPAPERRLLRSWKAIASHLDVNVRTAQRWLAQTDIPILREGTGRRAHPSAYTDELTAWLEQRRRMGMGIGGGGPHSRRRLALLAAVLTVAGATIAWLSFDGTGEPARIEAEGDTLSVFDAAGHPLWQATIPAVGRHYRWETARGDRDNFLIADVDDDGHTEVLINQAEQVPGTATGRLLCFSRTGAVRWSFDFGRPKSWGPSSYSAKFSGRWIRKVRGPKGPLVAAGAVHTLWPPAQIVMLEPRSGRLVDEYFHPGSLLHPVLMDLDGDGLEELLVGGINNPAADRAHGALAVLAVPPSRTGPAAGALAGFSVTREVRYALFPTPDVCTVTGTLPMVGTVDVEENRLVAQISCAPSATAVYYFDRSLAMSEFRLSDGFAAVHNRLFTQGLLDHPFSEGERACLSQLAWLPGVVDGSSPDLAAQLWPDCPSSRSATSRTPRSRP